LQKQTTSRGETVRKTTKIRESVAENVEVIEDIHKEVKATPKLRVSSMTKVRIWVDGKKVSSG
jgi:hypothetical protein